MAGTTTKSAVTTNRYSDLRDLEVHFNKLVDDAETVRGAASDSVVAVTELMADHATFKTAADQVETLIEELSADHATFVTVVTDVKALLNQLEKLVRYLPLGNPGFAILTNFDVQNANAISYLNLGTLKSLAAAQSWDTGTTKVITANQWNAALLSLTSAGATRLTWAAAAGYATEVLAWAALTNPAATDTLLGVVSVKTGAGVTWTAGTDALKTGTGGTVATETNYNNEINSNSLLLAPAVSSSPPATLAAPNPASAPATLAAAVPSATAINAAGDLTAAKIGDFKGTAITA